MEFNLDYKIDWSQHKSKEWLVLCNGLFASYQTWEFAIEELSKGHNILRFNSRGQGPDNLRDLHLLSEQILDLVQLMNHLEIDRAKFLGISNGARIALGLAEFFPDRVKHIIAADTYDILTPILKLQLESWLKANQLGGSVARFAISTPWIFSADFIQLYPEILNIVKEDAIKRDSITMQSLILSALNSPDLNLDKTF